MAGQAGLGFGLLRQLRDDAGLTQDELAEAGRVSQRDVGPLEQGVEIVLQNLPLGAHGGSVLLGLRG